jgi:hypothetical protein
MPGALACRKWKTPVRTVGDDISIFKGSLPPEAGILLERLYHHIYSSAILLRTYGSIDDETHTYIARKNGKEVTALVFRFAGRQVRVLNEQIAIDASEIERFSACIFKEFSSVSCVIFNAIDYSAGRLRFPVQRVKCSEDFVLKLPRTTTEYRDGLGSSTRNYIKRYGNKLARAFPSHTFSFLVMEEAGEQDIAAILELNRIRMLEKGRSPGVDEVEAGRIIQLARSSGAVGLLRIDGKICAGTINFRCGNNYFLSVIGHDPRYNDYRIGVLCCYMTICQCIEQGGDEYHFMWGRFDYKFRLGGVLRDLHQVAIYSSRRQALLNGRTALTIACKGVGLAARRWLLRRAEHEGTSFGARLLFHGLNKLRALRR